MMTHTATVLDLAVQLSDRLVGCAVLAAVFVAGRTLRAAGRPQGRLQAIPVRSRTPRPRS